MRPESRPEPSDVEVVTGTVEAGPRQPRHATEGDVPEASIVDETGPSTVDDYVEPDDATTGRHRDRESDVDSNVFTAEPARFLAAPAAGLSPLGQVGGVSVTLFVSDLARSLRFYRDTLGLAEIDSARGNALLASGDAHILLKRVVDMRPVDRRIIHLNLEVADVHAAYEELRAKGVEFVHRPRVVSQGEQLELWAATFRDPDGHAIALTRWELRR